MKLNRYLRFSVIPRDWHLKWVRGCSAVQNQGVNKKLNIGLPQAKCIRTDRHTDSQKQGDHWQSGEIQKLRHSCMKKREQKKRKESERNTDFERKEFKGIREQMANCTRVSQPGSKSVLCIRTGMGGGDGGGGVGDGRGPWRKLGSAIRP